MRASDNECPAFKNDQHKPRSSCQMKKEFIHFESGSAEPTSALVRPTTKPIRQAPASAFRAKVGQALA